MTALDAFYEGAEFEEMTSEAYDEHAGDYADELEEFNEGELADEHDLFGSAEEEELDELDQFGAFELDAATGLHLPATPRLVTGPAAVQAARQLNPAVMAALPADEADEFFRRVARAARGAVRIAGRAARSAAPLLSRALPIVQRVAGMAGPWGRLVSAGIGAARGLASGRGLRGALAGAIGGAIPGIGGRIASAVLRGDGADDDAALDAMADMADMADARQIPAAVALPIGAGLAARLATRQALQSVGSAAPPAARAVWAQARRAEPLLLRTSLALPGSIGRRLRLLRAAARLAARTAAQSGTRPGTVQALPAAVRAAAAQVARVAAQNPIAGVLTPAQAAARVAARSRILAGVRQAVTQGR